MTQTKPSLAISELLAAIESTSSEMNDMNERVVALEAINYRLNEENTRLRAELSEMIKKAETARSSSRQATQGADLAEAKAAEHHTRAEQMRTQLLAANDDIEKISSAVANLLARGELRR